jgi:predicted nucleic acid-binding protein
MPIFVDTSVWSLALRRDAVPNIPEVAFLRTCLEQHEIVVTTGLILQELLQGFDGPKARQAILERFSALPAVYPDRQDHVAAAGLRNHCRRKGLQIGTIDAVLIQLCNRHNMTMLTTDKDFVASKAETKLQVWSSFAG